MFDNKRMEKNKFNTSYYIPVDLDTFDPNFFFNDYHWWETYDVDKIYEGDDFKKNIEGEERYYHYVLYCIYDKKNKDKEKRYIVAKESMVEEYLKKYCSCISCKPNEYITGLNITSLSVIINIIAWKFLYVAIAIFGLLIANKIYKFIPQDYVFVGAIMIAIETLALSLTHIGPCCAGCLNSFNYSQEYINRARNELKEKNQKSKNIEK